MWARIFKRLQLWFYTYLWAWAVVLGGSLRRRRMSHNNGIAARGRVKIIGEPGIPAHPFFEPGREFPCRLRHASVSYDDDTVIQVRSASLKFADSPYKSPLDLEMNTGTISLFWTARNFIEFAMCREMTNGIAFLRFYNKYPRGLIAAKSGIRKYPSSFANLHYHSQCAQLFIGLDGIKRYAKFRLLPMGDEAESGIIPPEELPGLWSEEVAPGETRSPNYLKREFADRLGHGKVCYRLQIQLHTPGAKEADENDEIFNCNIEWDETTHPYQDIALVTLDELLSLDESNQMRFNVGQAPPSLGLLPSYSVDGYNSVNYMRARSGIAKRLRIAAYRILGMPKPTPERG